MKHCSISSLVTLCFVASFRRTLGEMTKLMDECSPGHDPKERGEVYIRF